MATVNDLMLSIANMEGFNTPGTIANRLNNPGNLRYAPTQSGSSVTASGTFATFDTPQEGWDALQSYIDGKASQGVTLRNFIYTYAPPSENDTSSYLNYVSGQLGMGVDSSLAGLTNGSALDLTGSGSDLSNISSDVTAGLDLTDITGMDNTTLAVLAGLVVVGVVAVMG